MTTISAPYDTGNLIFGPQHCVTMHVVIEREATPTRFVCLAYTTCACSTPAKVLQPQKHFSSAPLGYGGFSAAIPFSTQMHRSAHMLLEKHGAKKKLFQSLFGPFRTVSVQKPTLRTAPDFWAQKPDLFRDFRLPRVVGVCTVWPW